MTTESETRLENARNALAAERRRSLREINAFEAFLDRVEDLNTVTSGTTAQLEATAGALRVQNDSACAQTTAVWSAYCETVLDVPHFESDYRETPSEHLRAELGDDLAGLITTTEELTDYHKRIITSRVNVSITRRNEQIETVEEEVDMVDQAEHHIIDAQAMLSNSDIDMIIEMPIDHVEETKTQHEELIDRCDQLLVDRQQMLDSRPEAKRLSREATVGYLYRNLEVTYPVIVTLTKLRERLENRRMDLEALLRSQ